MIASHAALAAAPLGQGMAAEGFQFTLDGGQAHIAMQSLKLWGVLELDGVNLALPFAPTAKLFTDPMIFVADAVNAGMDLSIHAVHFDLRPLENSGNSLPGGFINALIKARLQAVSSTDVTCSIHKGHMVSAAKNGILHTQIEGTLGWADGHDLALKIEALRVNFGLPIPRSLLLKRLEWLGRFDFLKLSGDVVTIDLDALAKLLAESSPRQCQASIPSIRFFDGKLSFGN